MYKKKFFIAVTEKYLLYVLLLYPLCRLLFLEVEIQQPNKIFYWALTCISRNAKYFVGGNIFNAAYYNNNPRGLITFDNYTVSLYYY